MPPSLLVTSTRDILLSDTATFHSALLQVGVDAQLVVFEALPQALELMAKFLRRTTRAVDSVSCEIAP
jgi:acetyl esterase/lipase